MNTVDRPLAECRFHPICSLANGKNVGEWHHNFVFENLFSQSKNSVSIMNFCVNYVTQSEHVQRKNVELEYSNKQVKGLCRR